MNLAAAAPASELSLRQIGRIGGGYLSMLGGLAGQTLFIALFGGAIRAEYAISAGQYGLIYTVATLASAAIMVFAGGLVDRHSPRRIAIFCCAGLALACLGMAFSNSITILMLALFGLRLFGQGMIVHNCATAMARWFVRFRGRAMAISQFGYSTGEALLPLLVTFGIAAWGWRNVWLASAALLAFLFAPAIGLLFSPPRNRRHSPPAEPSIIKETGLGWTRRRVLGDRLFWALFIGILAQPAILTALLFHQTNLLASKGWSPIAFASYFPVLSVTSAVAGIAGGALIDRIGAHRLLPGFLLPLALANAALWWGRSEWTIPIFFVLAGISGSVVGTTLSVLWAEVYGTAHLGAIRAVATAGMVFASAAGPGIAGLLIDIGIAIETQCLAYAFYCVLASLVYLATAGAVRRRIVLVAGG